MNTRDIKLIKKKMVNIGHKTGHLASSFSAVDILYSLYTFADINKENAANIKNRDIVIISKEHCRLAQVCILAHLGLIESKLLETYLTDDGALGHDIYNFVSEGISAVDYGSGSLGHGLSVGAGLAMSNPNRKVYVLIGDGEMQEGSMWEALLFIIQHKLKNLIVICDRNYMQIDGYTKNIIDTSSNIKKLAEDMGFFTLCCNGHDISEIKKCLKEPHSTPKFIIANTVKGKGMEFLLNELGFAMFHHGFLNEQQKERILEALDE